MKKILLTTLVLLPGILACGGHDEHDGHDHSAGGETTESGHDDDAEHEDHAEHAAPHGGELLELGDHAGHLEVVYDEENGNLTLYVLAADAVTPLAIERAPELKLSSDSGPKAIATQALKMVDGKSSEFATEAGALKGLELQGRITVYIGDKVYNPSIAHDHDH